MSVLFLALLACSDKDTADDTADDTAPSSAEADTYTAEVWADNWSSMYVDGALVMEDSVSITTERSFNEEVFEFEATRPFVIAALLKDFIEDDSGLEYIGTDRQQMGDGGYIAQITDSSGELVAVSSSEWRCLTIHEAPLDPSCVNSDSPIDDCGFESSEAPEGWTDVDYDDSAWASATVYSPAEVDPKEGYDNVDWDGSADFIWGPDLQTHNTVMCRFTVE